MEAITPLIRERIKLLRDVLTAADFFFVDQLPPYDPAVSPDGRLRAEFGEYDGGWGHPVCLFDTARESVRRATTLMRPGATPPETAPRSCPR